MTTKRLLFVAHQRGLLKDTRTGEIAEFEAYLDPEGFYTVSCTALDVWTSRTSPGECTDSLNAAGIEIISTESEEGR